MCRAGDDFRIFTAAQIAADFFVDDVQRLLHVLNINICRNHFAAGAGKGIDASICFLGPPRNVDGMG